MGPSCVWHLHTWGHPRPQEAEILGAGMVVVASDYSHQGTYQIDPQQGDENSNVKIQPMQLYPMWMRAYLLRVASLEMS